MTNKAEKNKWLHILIIIVLTSLSYFYTPNKSFTLNNSFVYDDNTYVVENRQIRSISSIPKAFISSYPPDSEGQGLYRPLITVSYIIDYSFWGLNPKGFHLTNIILHILTSIIVYLLALEILKNSWPSLIAALVFALHPVHTEAVTWVIGRAEVMAGLFYFLAFLLYIKAGESASFKNRLFIALIVCYLYYLALLSKEMALTLPILLFAYDYYFVLKTPSPQPSPQRGEGVKWSLSPKGRGDKRESLPQGKRGHYPMERGDSPPLMGGDKGEGEIIKWLINKYLPFIVITFIYIAVRFAVLGAFGPQKNLSFTPDMGIYERFLTIIVVIGYYIRLLFIPLNLTVDYVFPRITYINWPVLIYGGTLLITIIAAALVYKKSRRLSFSILIFYITLLPVSNIIPIGELIAERFMYIPLFSFSLLLGAGTDYLFNRFSPENPPIPPLVKGGEGGLFSLSFVLFYNLCVSLRLLKGIVAFCLALLLALYSLLTISRNYDWQDAFTLWKATIYTTPLSSVAHNNLGLEYNKRGEYIDAIVEYKKAIEISPSYFHALSNLGDIYLKIGLIDEAIDLYKKAIEAEPDYTIAHNNIGFAYHEKGLYEKALAEYKKAIELNPRDPLFYNNLGNLYASMKRYNDAVTEYKKALSIEPKDVNAYNNLGVVYAKEGRFNEAEAEVRKALAIDPENTLTKKTLQVILNRGRIVVEDQGLSDRKNVQVAAYNELGNRYKQKGMYDDAITSYKKALEINPKDAGSHYNLGFAYVKKEMYKEAVFETEKALKLAPKLTDAHRNLGLIYLYLKDNKKAVYHFKRLLQIAPNQPDRENINKIIKEIEEKKKGGVPIIP